MPISTNQSIQQHGYETTLRAVGAEIDRLHLAEIVIVEVPQGLFLKGKSIISGRSGFHVEPRSGFIDNAAVLELMAAAQERRESRHRWSWERS